MGNVFYTVKVNMAATPEVLITSLLLHTKRARYNAEMDL